MHTRKLLTYDTGRLTLRSRSGNQYIIVAYHSSHVIFIPPWKKIKDQHQIAAYNSIIQRLKYRGLTIDLQILSNEASRDYKDTIKDKWGVDFQLVPPNIHRRNVAEWAIYTFKAHFLSILSGAAP